jgi:hypothetical protein
VQPAAVNPSSLVWERSANFFLLHSDQRQNKNDENDRYSDKPWVVLLHDGREVVIRHAILSFTDGIYEIIKRDVGTDG